jgi:hypothetical protein
MPSDVGRQKTTENRIEDETIMSEREKISASRVKTVKDRVRRKDIDIESASKTPRARNPECKYVFDVVESLQIVSGQIKSRNLRVVAGRFNESKRRGRSSQDIRPPI